MNRNGLFHAILKESYDPTYMAIAEKARGQGDERTHFSFWTLVTDLKDEEFAIINDKGYLQYTVDMEYSIFAGNFPTS